MSKALVKLHQLVTCEKGATMVEYGFMVVLIAIIVAVAVGPLGTAVSTMFSGVPSSL